MFNKLLNACNIFKVAAIKEDEIERALSDMAKEKGGEFDPTQAKTLAKELAEMGKGLQDPTQSDCQDMIILMKRMIKALSLNDIIKLIVSAKTLESLIRKFAPEKFNSEFADFVLDSDSWNFIYELKNKENLSKNDLLFLSILKDNLLYLISKPSLLI